MGLLDRLKRKKKDALDEPVFPVGAQPETAMVPPSISTSMATSGIKAEMDLILSQMENLRIQYEAINSRLQNIERVVAEIRSFCK